MSTRYLELLEAHHRRSVRLKDHVYIDGMYFVTICTRNRECLLGEIVGGKMQLNEYGRIVKEEWERTSKVRPCMRLDDFIVMPNHIHGVIKISLDPDYCRGTKLRAPTMRAEFQHTISCSLGSVIRGFKSSVTQRIRCLPGGYEGHFWQRNYFEHVICDEKELGSIRKYICENPNNWEQDKENIK
jgi:REP element-mobilizing transposase RayT